MDQFSVCYVLKSQSGQEDADISHCVINLLESNHDKLMSDHAFACDTLIQEIASGKVGNLMDDDKIATVSIASASDFQNLKTLEITSELALVLNMEVETAT